MCPDKAVRPRRMATALTIGGRDSHFLEQVMDRAARASVSDRLRVRMSLSTDARTGLKAENRIAINP